MGQARSALFPLLLIGVLITIPCPALSESGCAKQYDYSTQILETLVSYHQADSQDGRPLWQKAETLEDKMEESVRPNETCDTATNSRTLLAAATLNALSISNGTMPDTESNIRTAVDGMLLAVKTTGSGYSADFTQFGDMAEFGFNEDFFRWVLSRLVGIYRQNHYAAYELPDDTIKQLQYWFPDFNPSL